VEEAGVNETPFSPLYPVEGYLPLEDHGLVGDGTTAALVGRDGAISWLCVPRFDSPPLFCGLLEGDPTLSIRADEAEESWRIIEPVLGAWKEGQVPLLEYPAGSEGPPRGEVTGMR